MSAGRELTSRNDRFIAFIAVAFLFLAAVHLGLLVPVYAGLLVFASVMHLSARLHARGLSAGPAHNLAIGIISGAVLTAIIAIGLGVQLLLRNGAGLHDLLLKMSEIVSSNSNSLPDWLSAALPQQNDLTAEVGAWLKSHAAEIGTYSLDALKLVGYALVGILLGIMVAFSSSQHTSPRGPLSARLLLQLAALRDAFWRVAMAQIRISAVNTGLTVIYLMLVLPACGVHMPFTKTLVALTFVAGLLPIVGNLISNSAITIISFSLSVHVAMASLLFLVLVHKLEYFVNARIVGTQINARAWEMLLWMLLMERLFGPAGVVAAPVFYAWLKAEWHIWDHPVHGTVPAPAASILAAEKPAARTVHGVEEVTKGAS